VRIARLIAVLGSNINICKRLSPRERELLADTFSFENNSKIRRANDSG
jgi:hypothetical protein